MRQRDESRLNDDHYTEHDWKLFRSRIGGWQEHYMDKLNDEYVELLRGEGEPSEKFWALEKRIREDKRAAGVRVEMRRSALILNMASLYAEGAIAEEDLEGFSDDLTETLRAMLSSTPPSLR
ncbi:MAG: multidrug transporter [Eggerthellaceae bacterium]|nr:multidrug transporter [Eggerthellaceae bacterium]